METNTATLLMPDAQVDTSGFRDYLERSLRDPFTLDLSGLSLLEVIGAYKRAKSKLRPNVGASLSSLVFNLRTLEAQVRMKIIPEQITDVFWGYFIDFCSRRGLRASSLITLSNQLRAVLNWALKYNAKVSPTYGDFRMQKPQNHEIALTADEVSRVCYFDVDTFYKGRRKDYREAMRRTRDMFVLSCNLFQRHSDMVRISPECFDRNVFRIVQQKTGNIAVVDIDKYAIEAKTTYRILEAYHYEAPYKAEIGNYNHRLHELMQAIGFDELVRIEERGVDGVLRTRTVPKWKLISSHTARRTAITINVTRGRNVHELRKCSGHSDLRIFDNYVKD